ncbi:hypothetical protein VTK73DRAFT_1729 [Phialemonium thermophilum]|uniref:COX assembly mitochondrial protein n=1 Tax=Phialemonium thermophilum TaxID=223376 RepID=A0ABR3VT39_9PEZI
MHPHLHSAYNSGCQEAMEALEACHARGFLWKSMGMCNDAKTELDKCLRAQRRQHQTANRDGNADKKARIRQLWKEIDENS